jgi:hypothetical protein
LSLSNSIASRIRRADQSNLAVNTAQTQRRETQ